MPHASRFRRGGGLGRLIAALVVVIFALVSWFAMEKVTNPETGETYRRAMNVEQQKALGLEAAEVMIPQMGGAADPRTDSEAALVREVGRRLAESSGAAKTDFAGNFNFHLVDDPRTVNAFALPGGQISVTRGLFDQLQNEAQLAGVLAHEIGHVIAEHSAQQMAKGQLGQMLATAVAVGASDSEGRGQAAGLAAMAANQMLQLSYGREDESQADAIGLRYMTQAGYDPAAMLGVMEVLEKASEAGRMPEFLSSHPHPQTRIATIRQYLEENREQLATQKFTTGRPLNEKRPLQPAVR